MHDVQVTSKHWALVTVVELTGGIDYFPRFAACLTMLLQEYKQFEAALHMPQVLPTGSMTT